MKPSILSDLLIVTPVKNSLDTTIKTIEAVSQYRSIHEYLVFNDNSDTETTQWLEENSIQLGYTLLQAQEITPEDSPNQRALLIELLTRCRGRDILIVESDVIINQNTITGLQDAANTLESPGLIGAVTVDADGVPCFPHAHLKGKTGSVIQLNSSISFCCTLLSRSFFDTISAASLSRKKEWFDIFLSKKARNSGYKNYILLNQKVFHRPHSSRPWKKMKYTHPIRYYLGKFFARRDRI